MGPVINKAEFERVQKYIQIGLDDSARLVSGGLGHCQRHPLGPGRLRVPADPRKAHSIGARMRAGRIFYNGASTNNVAPMGGYKQSGIGREMGVFGLEEYLEVKAMIGFEALLPG